MDNHEKRDLINDIKFDWEIAKCKFDNTNDDLVKDLAIHDMNCAEIKLKALGQVVE